MADVTNPTSDGHLSEEQLLWHYYGEENAAEVDLHLQLCNKCRGEFESLKVAMKTIEAWPVPERSGDYGEQVWRALVKKDAAIGKRLPWWKQWLQPHRFVLAGSLAAMLVVAFLAGRVTHKPQPDFATAPQVVRERILAAALTEHLEQSQRVLLEISNGETEPADFRAEQQRAESLLAANRLYRQTAAREGHTALTGVLEDLERVLLDVAHAPEELSQAELHEIRERVDDQGLLFKVRILEERLRDVGNQPLPRPSPNSASGKEVKG